MQINLSEVRDQSLFLQRLAAVAKHCSFSDVHFKGARVSIVFTGHTVTKVDEIMNMLNPTGQPSSCTYMAHA